MEGRVDNAGIVVVMVVTVVVVLVGGQFEIVEEDVGRVFGDWDEVEVEDESNGFDDVLELGAELPGFNDDDGDCDCEPDEEEDDPATLLPPPTPAAFVHEPLVHFW